MNQNLLAALQANLSVQQQASLVEALNLASQNLQSDAECPPEGRQYFLEGVNQLREMLGLQ